MSPSAMRPSVPVVVLMRTLRGWLPHVATLLVLVALHRTLAGRWFTVLGAGSSVLILSGLLSPLDLPLVDTANFAGYVLWSLWLIALAVVLLRRPSRTADSSPQAGR